MAEVTMPRLSDTMEEGAVSRWLKQPGDHVENGEIIAEIETDKAVMDLMAFESGTLQTILVPEGQTVPIGEPIALIGEGIAEAAATTPPTSGTDQAPMEEGAPVSNVRTTAEARGRCSSARQPRSRAMANPLVSGSKRRRWPARWPWSSGSTCARYREPVLVGGSSKITSRNSSRALVVRRRLQPYLLTPAPDAPAASQAVPAIPVAPQAAPSGRASPVMPMSRVRRAVARAMSEFDGSRAPYLCHQRDRHDRSVTTAPGDQHRRCG